MSRLTAEQQQEIAAQQGARHQTRRATVPALEAILYEPLPVLDHGFIRVVDYMGDDAAIVQAARVSYGRGTRRISEDQGLINYLMRHRHTTPFEMCEIKYHVKLPIFVARQWIRHRTANVNEYSARYSILDKEFYIPEPEHLAGWYPQELVGDRRAGAPLRFVSPAGDGFDGQMLVFDPPEVMEFSWGADRLRIELRADGAGTLLTLTDTFDELGKAARDGAGWHECLDRLVSDLDGTPQRPWGERWGEVHPRYVTHLGPDAATIGPPPGWDGTQAG